MKAMILAAGRGERMRPLTDNCPKPLLQIGGQALIEYHIKALVIAGIKDIVINHAYLGKQIEAYLGDGEKYGAKILYSPEPEGGLETAGGIFKALPFLGSSPFLVVNGDIWCDYMFESLPTAISGLAHLVMIDNPAHNAAGDFSFHEGHLSNEAKNRLTYSGIGLYTPAFFSKCSAGRFPLGPMLRNSLANESTRKQVSAEHYNGTWVDVGTPERYEILNTNVSKC